ncbi:uncharacterized protein LOC135828649 [Sycon ciliatum]|uniref:uncharacterized protein LOC135828649 n=1 Tax=Sycon ciliatum TaxID=27933 RepID=UPI0020AD4C13|eukprot:scpid78116/ scgid12566/ 
MMAGDEKKEKVEKKERKKKSKEVSESSTSSKRARWKSECELDDCEMPGVAVGPWPVRISDTSSYVLGQMKTQSWGGGEPDVGDSVYMDGTISGVELLSNAGAWTETEAATLYYKKLKRLQRLYIGQVDRLRHEFRLLRHRYLGQLQHIDNGGTINSTAQMPHSVEGDATAVLRAKRASAVRRYKRFYGHDAVMQHRVRERRKKARQAALSTVAATATTSTGNAAAAEATAISAASSNVSKVPHCAHVGAGSTPCQSTCLPLTKYCRQHICTETGQFLFVPCEQGLSNGHKCGQPVPGYTALKRCFLHIDLVPLRCHRSDIEELHARWSRLHDGQSDSAAPVSVATTTATAAAQSTSSAVASSSAPLEHAAAATTASPFLHDDVAMDMDLVRALSSAAGVSQQSSSGNSSVSCLSASVTPPLQEAAASSMLTGSSVALVSAPLSALVSASPTLHAGDLKPVMQTAAFKAERPLKMTHQSTPKHS